jgi:lipid-binding SYLF domain-containing protein
MKAYMHLRTCLLCLLFVLPFGSALADEDAAKYSSALKTFQDAGESGSFFGNSYGYALFPTIGKGGLGVGGAYGKGRVYAGGKWVGDTSMSQLSFGWQAGAQAYSQIIFFEDKRSFDEFTSGNFEFSADASAVAITAGACRQKRCHHRRCLPQGHGNVYSCQGWSDVRSCTCRTEV